MPKSLRKHFVPAPETVEKALLDFDYDGRELVDAFADRLFRLSGTRVSASDFQLGNIEDYLALNIRVLDERGRLVASGRDIRVLRESLGQEVSEHLASRKPHPLERQGLTDWDFGTLPDSVEVREGPVNVKLYPALVDDGTTVSINLCENQRQARLLSEKGLLRLLLTRLADQRRFLEKNIPNFETFSLYYATRGTRAALIENLVRAVFRFTLVEGKPAVRNAGEFEARLEKRGELFERMEQVARIVASVLQQTMAIEGQLRENDFEPAASDIRRQLDRLLPADFPESVPFEWLRHYPRYFRAIHHRIERLPGYLDRDSQLIDIIRPLELRYETVEESERERLTRFRWMLEEFRISLFAQSIGTHLPVSEKRLEKEWREVMGLRQ